MKKKYASCMAIAIVLLSFCKLQAQAAAGNDTISFDYRTIFSNCLDGNVRATLLAIDKQEPLRERDRKFKTYFEERFKYETDKSNFLETKKSSIDELFKLYHRYWRRALLQTSPEPDNIFKKELQAFLQKDSPKISIDATGDTLDVYLKKYIAARGMHTTGFGKTGRLFDLLVWKSEHDTTYQFTLHHDTTSSRVILMDNFVTLGWEEYATLGRYYPGGWATHDALYCVIKSYDLNSEAFKISYLAHESRHFADYKIFPNLQSADLEYRAKLVELSMADISLYNLIDFFIANANAESGNGHSVANYKAMHQLSTAIFHTDFEKDMTKWKAIPKERLNEVAYAILEEDTKARLR